MIHFHLEGGGTETVIQITMQGDDLCKMYISNSIKDSSNEFHLDGSFDYDTKLLLDLVIPKLFTTLHGGGLITKIVNFNYDLFNSLESYVAVEILITLNECIAGVSTKSLDVIPSSEVTANINPKDWN